MLTIIISSIIINMSVIYILSKIFNKLINFKDYKLYLGIFILVVICILNFLYVESYLRFLVGYLVITAFGYFVFKPSLSMAIMGALVERVVMFVAEIIFIIIVILIFQTDSEWLVNNVAGKIITNVLISIIAITLISIKWIKSKSILLVNKSEKIELKHMITLVLLLVLTLNILLAISFYQLNILDVLIINSIFMFIYSAIILIALKEKSKNIEFKIQNDFLVRNLNEYEKMLDYQRVASHENKNQLLVIKTMVKKENKKIIDYIDEIVKDTLGDNEILLTQALKIPTGGLQGIVYQKMLLMQNENIKINLDISRTINDFNFDNLNTKANYDICRIMGVLLDNAIEETEKVENKEVTLTIYVEKNTLVIEVSNPFFKPPDLEKFSEKGYTTKKEGRGYGLSLVKEIVENNPNIINKKSIFKNVFTQIIKIKM